ncbi:flagellar hook-basal body complex protein FliE [Endozoicomonas ascidiicola]|uniref:flagellar hook-basal body complex protein FliE n=1 Tax=Endozoicomonas ascidiicola TaxID=1698521 RepID=UPI00082B75A8|nr:flagellar hook-basal body complex protein FliE [Endozoicomonas ascidiicola]
MEIKGLASSLVNPVRTERQPSVLPSDLSRNDVPDFTQLMKSAMDRVNELQQSASTQMHQVDTGESQDLLGTMIATQKASISFQALMQVRNKAVAAYEEVMRMQV